MTCLLAMLIAMPSWAQKTTLPVSGFEEEGAVQAVQMGLDEKFDVTGGTVTGNVNIASGTIRIGSMQITRNGLAWPDATTLTTASGLVIATASSTLSGANTFTSTNNFVMGLSLGSSADGTNNSAPITIWATSTNGTTSALSSGTVVMVRYSGSGGSLFANFTTTTTAQSTDGILGVIAPGSACTPSATIPCSIAIAGIVRITATAAVTVGDWVTTSATRNQADTATGSKPQYAYGRWLGTLSGAGVTWAVIGPP